MLVFILSPIHRAEAQVMSTVAGLLADALGWLLGSVIFPLLGWVLKWILEALVSVAEYNKIINQSTIQNTWGTVRDIVNMFFIFAMLLIAFSTILRYQQYEVKKMLPKLVLYAVLVNFSLTICGLFIDIAQVFTLTFVNAFKDNAVNNFTQSVNIFDFTSMSSDLRSGINAATVMGGYLLALVLMLVTLVTLGAMVLMLLVRIVYLWILSILSPFAFVLPVIPGGQKYASQWWDMFSKQVITGPLLAFFIWLSLSVLANTGNIGNEILNSATKSTMTAGLTGLKTTDTDFIIHFIISIAMMFIGLMLTSQMGGAAGKIAGGASNWMQRSGTGFITGRLGPTPMRWARERYQSYRGQRESIRKESAQRFGQGVSAIQDRQISSRISGLVRGTAGQVTGAITGGRWVAGEKKQARAIKRFEDHKERQGAEDTGAMEALVRQKGYGKNEDSIRNRISNASISDLEHSVLTSQLIQRNMIKSGDEGIVNRTSQYLESMPKSFDKFSDTLKAKNLELAWATIYTDRKTGTKDRDSLKSDSIEGKVDVSMISDKIMKDSERIDVSGAVHSLLEDIVIGLEDSEKITKITKKLNKNAYDEGLKNFNISGSKFEKKLAFAKGRGGYKSASISRADLGTRVLADKEERKDFMQNSDDISFSNVDYLEEMYNRDTLPTKKQLEDRLEDPKSAKLIADAHEKMLGTRAGDYSKTARKMRNTLVKAQESNTFMSTSTGFKFNAYNLSDPKGMQAAKEEIRTGGLKGKNFGKTDRKILSGAEKNNLYELLTAANNSELKDLAQEDAEFVRDTFSYIKNQITVLKGTPAAAKLQEKLDQAKRDIILVDYV
ncbi:hypothetical protein EPN15_03650 [Patescibacteria group bacterium]|nr:MAG: hypothetical protein EPN15_03650 [Patescibacteria group bacterium]